MGHRVICIDSSQCPQFVNGLSIDPIVTSEKLDHVSITATRQNTFQEGNQWIFFSCPDFGDFHKLLSTQT